MIITSKWWNRPDFVVNYFYSTRWDQIRWCCRYKHRCVMCLHTKNRDKKKKKTKTKYFFFSSATILILDSKAFLKKDWTERWLPKLLLIFLNGWVLMSSRNNDDETYICVERTFFKGRCACLSVINDKNLYFIYLRDDRVIFIFIVVIFIIIIIIIIKKMKREY